MDEAAPIVAIDGLVKRFLARGRTTTALDGLSARILPGRITGIVGPDGAGKTTLMRLIAGLLLPDAGSIRVLGRDAVAEAEAIQAEIGYMPQRFGLYEELSAAENLALYADLHRIDAAARAQRFAELLRFTGLAPFQDRRAGKLSGGMKQKLGLACALLARPRLLLLDEPSVGVDPVSRRELWRIVENLVGEGITVLWSTAYLDEAERCAEVLLIDGGTLLAAGRPAEFAARMDGRSYAVAVPESGRRALQRRLARDPAVVDAQIQGAAVRIVLAEGAPAPAGAVRVAPRLEDAFVARLAHVRARGESARPTLAARAAADGPAIETRALVRDFGSFRAVDGISFSVARGEVFGLLGPNGAGKSTTFKMLCGLLPPSSGTARVAGVDLGHAPARARERLGYMAQRFSLYGDLSVRENLEFFGGACNLRGARLGARIDWVLDGFGLRAVAAALSGELPLGYKQRLALGCALIHEPEILFLDEPTSGVDPLSRREFWSQIGLLADHGVTVLVTSHFMEEAEYCDRLCLIYRGRTIAMGTPDGLKRRAASAALPDPTLDDAFVHLVADYDREHPP
ncbi:MAG: ABC transporter ATP-binding protein [Alphaproteobacteria bacterium]|nr:ABC transporter ATP-binding protein [Alphaproteobacteria bacterium]